MIDISYAPHAETRMQQRAIRKKDVPLIIELGTQIDDETWFMCNRDVTREIESLKREVHRLERLANCKVVMRGGRVITAYPHGQRIRNEHYAEDDRRGWRNDDGNKHRPLRAVSPSSAGDIVGHYD